MVMPMLARRTAALLLAALPFAPARAQDSTHAAPAADSVDVRRGDTLWDLAASRLGSPFRWPAIHEANAGRIANPHWIYPGQRLRMPGMVASVDVTAAERPAPVEEPPAAPAPLTWTVKSPTAGATAPAAVPAPAAWPARDTASRLLMLASAPYVGTRATLDAAGALVSAMDVARDGRRSAKQRFLLKDRVALTLPRGATPGGRFLLVRRGPELRGEPVLVPTAIVTVAEQLQGELAVGRIDHMFGAVEFGDRVIPMDIPEIRPEGPAFSVSRDARVLWVASPAELPSLGTPLILDVGAAERTTVDDTFVLRSPDQRVAGRVLAGSRVAVVRVLRVGPRTSTAVIVAQEQPSIAVGMTARPVTPATPDRP